MRQVRRAGVLLATLAMTVSATAVVAQSRAVSQSDRTSGARANPQLIAEYGGLYPGPQADYVRRVGQRIAVQSGLSNAQSDFSINLLNSPVNNAFAVPGGYVYVTRQLLGLMNDESELAFVMGHEIGHVAARHSSSRQTRSTITGLGALILGVVTGSSQVAQGASQIGQLYTLRFSRQQEFEADDLGENYLVRAGYDPFGAPRVLAQLAAQTALETRVSGQPARNTPSWASTHPDPASRVARAAQNAERAPRGAGERNAAAYLSALDGTLYGDDPHQGVVDGQVFRHPDLKLSFRVPDGYAITNGASAVTISGNGGQAQFGGGRFDGDMNGYVRAALASVSGDQGGVPDVEVSPVRIAGFDAATATVRAQGSSGPVDVTVVAYRFDATTAYHFVMLTPAGSGGRGFASMIDSMRRLSLQEASAIRPRRIRIVTATRADTVESLARRMAFGDAQIDRFRTINALRNGQPVVTGQRYKVVVYG